MRYHFCDVLFEMLINQRAVCCCCMYCYMCTCCWGCCSFFFGWGKFTSWSRRWDWSSTVCIALDACSRAGGTVRSCCHRSVSVGRHCSWEGKEDISIYYIWYNTSVFDLTWVCTARRASASDPWVCWDRWPVQASRSHHKQRAPPQHRVSPVHRYPEKKIVKI